MMTTLMIGRLILLTSSDHNLDLRDIRVYTNCFLICGVSGIIEDIAIATRFSQPNSPTNLPCKNPLNPQLFQYVLMRVSQILVV